MRCESPPPHPPTPFLSSSCCVAETPVKHVSNLQTGESAQSLPAVSTQLPACLMFYLWVSGVPASGSQQFLRWWTKVAGCGCQETGFTGKSDTTDQNTLYKVNTLVDNDAI